MPIKERHLIRPGQVKKWLGISEDTLRKFVDNGVIRAIRFSGTYSLYDKNQIARKFFPDDPIDP